MRIVYLMLMSIALVSCHRSEDKVGVEHVLSSGMIITAYTPNEKIVIKGGKGYLRLYSGDNWNIKSTLMPRDTRWYGSFGLYDPAGSDTKNGRLIVDEGMQFFNSEHDALCYMQTMKGYFGKLTYNKSGLVIAYKKIEMLGGEPTRSIAVWQFYVNGSKPLALRGGIDSKIKIEGGNTPEKAIPFPAPVGYERDLADCEYTPPLD